MFEHMMGREPGLIDSALYRTYAVLVPYLPETGELLFQVRSRALHRQPGEICFPGGAVEEGESPRAAAARECVEELLVEGSQMDILAPLDRMITSYNSIIYPFLANLNGYADTFSQEEVEAVFRVPFSFFLEREPEVYWNQIIVQPAEDFPYARLGVESYPWGSVRVPVLLYAYGDRVIWGITAKMVWNLVELYRAGV